MNYSNPPKADLNSRWFPSWGFGGFVSASVSGLWPETIGRALAKPPYASHWAIGPSVKAPPLSLLISITSLTI